MFSLLCKPFYIKSFPELLSPPAGRGSDKLTRKRSLSFVITAFFHMIVKRETQTFNCRKGGEMCKAGVLNNFMIQPSRRKQANDRQA